METHKDSPRRLHIAICGTRGIPARYGGFETFAEELSTRLVARGHKVTVYGRTYLYPEAAAEYRGVNLRLLPAPRHKYLETPVHSLLSLIDLVRSPADVILVCNAANSPFIWIPRLLRKTPVAINVDGIERMRAKWNILGRLWYRLGERCSVLFSTKLISDAEVIRDYYRRSYGADSVVLRYGTPKIGEELAARKVRGETLPPEDPALFQELGITSGEYILYVSRLEPENNAHVVIEAYNKLDPELKRFPLVIVGDAPYADQYIAALKAQAGEGVRFAGYRFGPHYKALQLGARVYVQATEVGGTHPALVEAMGFANCVLANGTPENTEVIADAGIAYPKNDAQALSALLAQVLGSPEQLRELREKAYRRAQEHFDWDKITSAYEQLLLDLHG